MFGAPSAPVTLLEIGAFECPACEQLHRTLYPEVVLPYIDRGQVRLRYVDISQSVEGRAAARLFECAALSGGDVEKVVSALEHLRSHSASVVADSTCMDSQHLKDRRIAERIVAGDIGARGTPTLLIGFEEATGSIVGWPILGVPSADTLRVRIDSALAILRPLH